MTTAGDQSREIVAIAFHTLSYNRQHKIDDKNSITDLLPLACYAQINNKVKLVTLVEGDPKAPFSIATTPRCRGECYSIPLYPWSLPYNAKC